MIIAASLAFLSALVSWLLIEGKKVRQPSQKAGAITG
jgi:hypothetical protein